MARQEHFYPTDIKLYPDAGVFSMPVEETQLPQNVEANLPKGTKYIRHNVYLGTNNYVDQGEVRRAFREHRAPVRGVSGTVVSAGEYKRILAEANAASAPEEDVWQLAGMLYVPALRALATVELPTDGTEQSRVTLVGQKRVAKGEEEALLPPDTQRVSLDGYVEALEDQGFPKDAFNYVRRSWRGKQNQTGVLADTLQNPVVLPVAWLIDQGMVRPLMSAQARIGRHGNLKETIRTNNPNQIFPRSS